MKGIRELYLDILVEERNSKKAKKDRKDAATLAAERVGIAKLKEIFGNNIIDLLAQDEITVVIKTDYDKDTDNGKFLATFFRRGGYGHFAISIFPSSIAWGWNGVSAVPRPFDDLVKQLGINLFTHDEFVIPDV